MSEEKFNFKYQKKIGVNEMLYGNIPELINMIHRLLVCMKESNHLNKHECEFFRLDFRMESLDEEMMSEFPLGSLVLDLKWGCKDE